MSRDASLSGLVERLDRIADVLETLVAPAPDSDTPPGRGRAFVWGVPTGFRAVRRPSVVDPAVLTGVDRQKKAFYQNMQRFVAAGDR